MSPADTPLPHGISVVVPVYNSENSLGPLLERLEAVLTEIGLPFEVLLVNDGSRDRSWETICRLAATRPWLRGINLMRNYGQHNTLLCGIREVRYDRFVTIDDDLQNPPEEIPTLLAKLEEGLDVVYGTPNQEQHGLWRDLASQVTKIALQTAMGVSVARKVSAFRAVRTQVRDAFKAYRGPFVSIDVLLTWGTSRFAAVVVRHEERRIGASNYTFTKLVFHALNMMTGFSVKPLQVASVIGFGFTLFGIGILFFVLIRYAFQGAPVPGFPFLASVIAIFSGVQLFALGIIGEYLARMHFRMMDRPTYTVRETVVSSGEEGGAFEVDAIFGTWTAPRLKPSAKRDLPPLVVEVHLPDANPTVEREHLEEIQNAVGAFLRTFGFMTDPERTPSEVHASWHWTATFRRALGFGKKEAPAVYDEMKEYLRRVGTDKAGADAFEVRSRATARLIKSLEPYPHAIMRLGDVIIAKAMINGEPYLVVETISPQLARQMEQNPTMSRCPVTFIRCVTAVAADMDSARAESPPPQPHGKLPPPDIEPPSALEFA